MSKHIFLFITLLFTHLSIIGITKSVTPFENICNFVERFKPKFSGYIKHEGFFDSRQVESAGNGHALLFPKKEVLDFLGNDINSKGQFNSVPIETRANIQLCGPTICNAKTSAVIEADFIGPLDRTMLDTIPNLVRMRHAFMRFEWKKIALLAGQYWHPLTVPECFADTISFNSGSPMEPFGRRPQLRFTHYGKHTTFIAAATSQLDIQSLGPIGPSTTYQRNAIVPNLHIQLQTVYREQLFGIGFDYKRICPRCVTDKNIKVRESLNSIAALFYATLQWRSCIFSTKLTYGQNATDYSLLGGYAVSSIDSRTDERTYTNLRVIGWWADMAIKKKVEPGLFVGYIKNLGAQKDIIQSITDAQGNTESLIFALGPDIDNLFRIAPRLRWFIKKFTFGVEVEYTRTDYGIIQNNGRVADTIPVSNTRLLVALFYSF